MLTLRVFIHYCLLWAPAAISNGDRAVRDTHYLYCPYSARVVRIGLWGTTEGARQKHRSGRCMLVCFSTQRGIHFFVSVDRTKWPSSFDMLSVVYGRMALQVFSHSLVGHLVFIQLAELIRTGVVTLWRTRRRWRRWWQLVSERCPRFKIISRP